MTCGQVNSPSILQTCWWTWTGHWPSRRAPSLSLSLCRGLSPITIRSSRAHSRDNFLFIRHSHKIMTEFNATATTTTAKIRNNYCVSTSRVLHKRLKKKRMKKRLINCGQQLFVCIRLSVCWSVGRSDGWMMVFLLITRRKKATTTEALAKCNQIRMNEWMNVVIIFCVFCFVSFFVFVTLAALRFVSQSASALPFWFPRFSTKHNKTYRKRKTKITIQNCIQLCIPHHQQQQELQEPLSETKKTRHFSWFHNTHDYEYYYDCCYFVLLKWMH